ncbi:hypothetical protein J4573_51150 [Actinomadura barringtoniae]|uniref:Uncharacterized protein n=1 Tax=Actinomadura barringtoniae TaxID=1427535 RepID=A0A939TAK7_9ACTN|nr:hypothetical protein [Actinomadura barringtoniae]MBO2455514.1 hypothetical protein [Actinomadura barringtoniae]
MRDEVIDCLEGVGGQLERFVFEDGPPLDRDAVFVVNAPRQHSDLADRLGGTSFADGASR